MCPFPCTGKWKIFPNLRKCPRIHDVDYFESGRTVLLVLTNRRNDCYGIFDNNNMFRNKIIQTHPQFFVVSKQKDDDFMSAVHTDRRIDLILNLMVNKRRVFIYPMCYLMCYSTMKELR